MATSAIAVIHERTLGIEIICTFHEQFAKLKPTTGSAVDATGDMICTLFSNLGNVIYIDETEDTDQCFDSPVLNLWHLSLEGCIVSSGISPYSLRTKMNRN